MFNKVLQPKLLCDRKLKSWWRKRKIIPRLKEEKDEEAQDEMNKKKEVEVSPWEEDYELLVCEGLFSEYLEMGKSYQKVLHRQDSCPVIGCIECWLTAHLCSPQWFSLGSSRSLWPRVLSHRYSLLLITGWRFVWMLRSLWVNIAAQWWSELRISASGFPSCNSSLKSPSLAM